MPERSDWTIPDDVIYLNHGSFGPSPQVVQQVRREWTDRLERQPMDFYLREMEDRLIGASRRAARFVGADADGLVFMDNATTAMNVVAASVPLDPGDEVLFTDHEYGAVLRIWRRACRACGARAVVRELPDPIGDTDELVQQFLQGVTERTRLIVVSHVTSPTAVILPVEKICKRAKELGVPVCIDGPHAPAMIPVDIAKIGCDFYTASCHKWLCAPFGTGFLYVGRGHRKKLQPSVVSWGGSIGARQPGWKDEFNWIGTRDPAGFLAVPAAIDFLEQAGWNEFRETTHQLAQYALQQMSGLTVMEALIPDSTQWYGSMITVPIPASAEQPPQQGRRDPLQDALWEKYRIEVPIVHWGGRRFVRVSCHLYNCRSDVDRLVAALSQLLKQ